jgi:hypothetical protein
LACVLDLLACHHTILTQTLTCALQSSHHAAQGAKGHEAQDRQAKGEEGGTEGEEGGTRCRGCARTNGVSSSLRAVLDRPTTTHPQ